MFLRLEYLPISQWLGVHVICECLIPLSPNVRIVNNFHVSEIRFNVMYNFCTFKERTHLLT